MGSKGSFVEQFALLNPLWRIAKLLEIGLNLRISEGVVDRNVGRMSMLRLEGMVGAPEESGFVLHKVPLRRPICTPPSGFA